jgi:hypothetical protein
MKKIFKYFIKYLFSPAILLISIFIFLMVIYKSEIIFQGLMRNYYIQYYAISIILIFISIYSFFFNEKIKLNIFIIFFSITFTVYLLEFSLLISAKKTNNVNDKKKLFSKLKLEFDDRSKMQIYEDLKKINNNYVITVSPQNYLKKKIELFPLSGFSNSPTIYCNENGYYSIYNSDRYGFNNPDEIWDLENIEYLIVGDSFAQGACVNRPDDFTSIFRTLSNKNALNLGYSGHGPIREYASLKEYMNLKKIKNVIWLFYSNDINDLKHEYKNVLLRNYITDNDFKQNLYLKQNLIDKLVKNEILNSSKNFKKRNLFNLESFIKLANLRQKIQFESKEVNDDFKEIIQLANKFSRENNANFYFVYLPSFEEIGLKGSLKTYLSTKKLINELEIPFIDIYDFLKKNKNNLDFFPLKMEGHYNEYGYKVIGKKIYQDLSKF